MPQGFWDKTWAKFEPFNLNPDAFRGKAGPSDKMFLDLIGDVNGKDVLEIGCGNGLLSVYLAKMGGRFDRVYLHYTEFEFFKLMDKYLFKHNKKNIFEKMDKWIYNQSNA